MNKIRSIIFESFSEVNLDNISVPVVSIDSLIVLKLYAGGRIDIEDAINLIKMRNYNQEELEKLTGVLEKLQLKLPS